MKAQRKEKLEIVQQVVIAPLRLGEITLKCTGKSPFMQQRFSEKARKQVQMSHIDGKASKSKKKREPRDFKKEWEGCMYKLEDGSFGIPAASFRNAAIESCRVADFKMTIAKRSIWVEHDGYDHINGTPLVKLNGNPEPFSDKCILPVRNSTGVMDLRARPVWKKWHIDLRVKWDLDQFTTSDIVNLFNRAGLQNGVGEGRMASRMSNGQGYGVFKVEASA